MSSGPNPPCEVGRRHARDRHRMRPVEGQEHLWYCPKHGMYASLVDKAEADAAERGMEQELSNGVTVAVVGKGDERQGGVLLYLREA